jgi:hypothetical protein
MEIRFQRLHHEKTLQLVKSLGVFTQPFDDDAGQLGYRGLIRKTNLYEVSVSVNEWWC